MPSRPSVFQPCYAPARVEQRGSASARGYDRAWQKVRAMHLAAEPLCRMCHEAGVIRAAEHVDHVQTIRDRPDLRLADSNLRSLCAECHNRHTASQPRSQA